MKQRAESDAHVEYRNRLRWMVAVPSVGNSARHQRHMTKSSSTNQGGPANKGGGQQSSGGKGSGGNAPNPNWPSTTGNPSGGGRGNNPPKK
jgi:hypothetical protein